MIWRLVGWLVGWLAYRLVGWLMCWLVGRLVGWLVDLVSWMAGSKLHEGSTTTSPPRNITGSDAIRIIALGRWGGGGVRVRGGRNGGANERSGGWVGGWVFR